MREAGLWLAAEPGASNDLKLLEDVRNCALYNEAQAFDLLEKELGTGGIDILYDIAYGASGHLYAVAAARAKQTLTAADVRGRASPALRVS
jgi:hypothetical protein